MSTQTLSLQLDKLSDSSTVVGVAKTREEYLKLFSRASYSSQYDRPYSSPVSGVYNAINTTTSLLLLNHRVKNSHLREQVLPEELTNRSQQEYDYEKNIIHHTFRLILTDILKGQTKYWHNRRCTSSSLVDNSTDVSHTEPTIPPTRSRTSHMSPRRSLSVNHRSQSAAVRKDKYYDEPQSFTESFCQYYRDVVDNSKQSELSSEQHPIKESSNPHLKSNRTRRKLPLTKGQQLYLLEKYHIYDIKDSKVRRSNSYAQTISNRYKAGLNDPRDYFKYAKILRAPCSLTSTASSKSIDNKNQLTNTDSHKSFTMNNDKIPVTLHIRQEPKQITTINI